MNKIGFCTGFATTPLFSMDFELPTRIMKSGYDYVEFPLMTIHDLSDEDFSFIVNASLTCTVFCNLFPGRFSPYIEEDYPQIIAYLDKAFTRLKALGGEKVVFGSGAFRTPKVPNQSKAQTLSLLLDFCKSILCPKLEQYNIKLVLEPLNTKECPIINTIKEGQDFVDQVNHPNFVLLADLYHMYENKEDLNDLCLLLPKIEHVHICNYDRNYPSTHFDPYILEGIKILREQNYQNTISFESKNNEDLSKALNLLKKD